MTVLFMSCLTATDLYLTYLICITSSSNRHLVRKFHSRGGSRKKKEKDPNAIVPTPRDRIINSSKVEGFIRAASTNTIEIPLNITRRINPVESKALIAADEATRPRAFHAKYSLTFHHRRFFFFLAHKNQSLRIFNRRLDSTLPKFKTSSLLSQCFST